MIYHRRHGWELPASATTPESVFLNRRAALLGAGALIGAGLLPRGAHAEETIKTADLYPAKLNDAYKLDRPVTPEKTNETYNNFYEFSLSKRVDASRLAWSTAFRTSWRSISETTSKLGMVES